MNQDELLSKGLAAAKAAEARMVDLAKAKDQELQAKIDLEDAKALAETHIIEAGGCTGKTVADRERELAVALLEDKPYQTNLDAWIRCANLRHIAEARSGCAYLVAEMYRNALAGEVR